MSAANVRAEMTSAFASEVVTHAKMRLVDLPLGAGKLALITLDNDQDHTRPSTFGPGGLASLDAALDLIGQQQGLVGVAVTGKPFIFAVGADLSGVDLIDSLATARTITELGHRVFSRLGSCRSRLLRSSTVRQWVAALNLHCTAPTEPSPPEQPGWRCPRCFSA